jgi:hypothetical protein
MTCGIDEILGTAGQTLTDTTRQLVRDLGADFNLTVDEEAVLHTPEAGALRDALDQFTVWFVRHNRGRA